MPTAADEIEAHLVGGGFAARHVKSALGHFTAMSLSFQQGDWEPATAKAGKLLEAVAKALLAYAGKPVPTGRAFKVSQTIQALEQLPVGSFDDTIRLIAPRATRFAYDIASNRGSRHDPDEIDSNEMDATVVVSTCSWIIAELVRLSAKKTVDTKEAQNLISRLTEKKYPSVEEVDGRVYFHYPNLSARDVAILALWHSYPGRRTREEVASTVRRHGFSAKNAATATRIARLVDDGAEQGLRLLQPGLRQAEELVRPTES